MKIFYQKKRRYNTVGSILGVSYIEKRCRNNKTTFKFCYGLYKTIKSNHTTKYYLFGIKILQRTNRFNLLLDKLNKVNDDLKYLKIKHKMQASICKIHSKVFPQFKNIYKNKKAVIIATGPTLCNYSYIRNAVHIGVNSSFKKCKLDYWFAIDYAVNKNYIEELKNTDFIKFFGQCSSSPTDHYYRFAEETFHFPDAVIDSCKNSFKFYFDHPSLEINRDIETEALPDLGSCVFSALTFAIYLGCNEIYLVGCDCSANGYWNLDVPHKRFSSSILKRGWNIYKRYLEVFYPNIKIISINPIGLKGMFNDIYTDEQGNFINEQGEIININ